MEFKEKHLSIFLYLVALHSLAVGVALIAAPAPLFEEFGYNRITENFFRAQGGVFHLVMVAAYFMAGFSPNERYSLVKFSIIAKFMAVIFLFFYFFTVDGIVVVLLSGVGDFIMGVVILILSLKTIFRT